MRSCVVVMGPSGVGKTTIAQGLADRLGWTFAEADGFHPSENIRKMSRGEALTDDDRWPWLAALRDWIGAEAARGRDSVITCSALKRSYRDRLREADARVRFLELHAAPAVLAERVARRIGHYMPPSLVASQLATLEPLQPDEDGVRVDAAGDPAETVRAALDALGLG